MYLQSEGTMSFRNLSAYLKRKRLTSGLTQAQLGKKLKKTHSQFVSNWERGLCAPPGHCMEQLIEVLNLDRTELVEAMMKDAKSAIRNKVYDKTGS